MIDPRTVGALRARIDGLEDVLLKLNQTINNLNQMLMEERARTQILEEMLEDVEDVLLGPREEAEIETGNSIINFPN